jgi:hypothetical protein
VIRRLLLALLMTLAAAPVFAQDGWDGRVRISVSAGSQLDTNRLSESISLTKNVESAPVTADLAKAAVPFFDGGLAVRLFGNVGAAVSVSYLTNTADADVTARIPHPFFFNRPRTVTGQAQGVRHAELATHVDAVYVIVSSRIDLTVFGGASFFRVDQDFVSDVLYGETYPYDTAAFVSAKLTRVQASKTGYNAGADVTWKLGDRWGVGGLLRYSRARIPFSFDGIDPGTSNVGGLQAGGGLRLMF